MLSSVGSQHSLFIYVYHHGEKERGANMFSVELLTELTNSRELAQLATTKDTKENKQYNC